MVKRMRSHDQRAKAEGGEDGKERVSGESGWQVQQTPVPGQDQADLVEVPEVQDQQLQAFGGRRRARKDGSGGNDVGDGDFRALLGAAGQDHLFARENTGISLLRVRRANSPKQPQIAQSERNSLASRHFRYSWMPSEPTRGSAAREHGGMMTKSEAGMTFSQFENWMKFSATTLPMPASPPVTRIRNPVRSGMSLQVHSGCELEAPILRPSRYFRSIGDDFEPIPPDFEAFAEEKGSNFNLNLI